MIAGHYILLEFLFSYSCQLKVSITTTFLTSVYNFSVTEGQMDGLVDGRLGLGRGGGHLELGGEGEGRLGGAVAGAQVGAFDDDDDGC